MEEIKEFEKEERNWKWLLLIPIIIGGGIGLVLGYHYLNENPINLPTFDTQTTTITSTGTTIPVEAYTVTGNNIINEQIESSKIIDLKAGRYNLKFESSDNVVVSLRRNPNGFFVCCDNKPKLSGVYSFDVNSGAGGDYILMVQPSAHVTISQVLAF